jgi:anti-anti-sigma regulatory factor
MTYNTENIKRNDHLGRNLHPQFQLDEAEARNYRDILKRQADEKPFTIIKKNNIRATIIKINHLRASANEAIKFKEFMQVNIHQGHLEFIIDFSNCEFMDSTFLGSVILITKKLNLANGSLSLVADPLKLKVLHALIELSKILSVYPNLEEAEKKYLI